MVVAQASFWRTAASEGSVLDPEAEQETPIDPEDGTDGEMDLEDDAPEIPALTREEAEDAWTPAAQEILVRVAGTYGGLIEYAELGAEIQETTGIATRMQTRSWVGRVLALVAAGNHERGEPALTSLVVHKSDGMVGVGYDNVLKLLDAPELGDPIARENHAATARLECYRWAGAEMPETGGRATLSPRLEQSRARLRKQRREAEQPTICPTCFMAIPPTGVCDNCG